MITLWNPWEIIMNIKFVFKQTLDDGTAPGCNSNGAVYIQRILYENNT